MIDNVRSVAPVAMRAEAPLDHRPTASLIDPLNWAIGVAALLLGIGVRGPIAGAIFGIVVVIMPGALVAPRVAARDSTQRIIIVVTVSVVFWMVVAHLLLSVGLWHPAVVSCVLLVAMLVVRVRYPVPVARREHHHRFSPNLGHSRTGFGLLALLLWAVSLPQINLAGINDWGLISVLPITYFIGLTVAVFVAVHAALDTAARGPRLAIGLTPLLLMIYGTLAVLVPTMRYPWSYRHLGIVRLLDDTGQLHPHVDIYNNFSGFFGLGALIRGATGVDPASYGAWAQLVGESIVLVGVAALVKSATRSTRVAHLAVVIYLLTNWVGQNYFAPQTLASLLSIGVLGLILDWFGDGTTRFIPMLKLRLARIGPLPERQPPPVLRARRRIVVAFVFLGLLMTHPLTPIALGGVLVVTCVVGWFRDRALIVSMIVLAVLWGLRIVVYVLDHANNLGFGGSVSANANGNSDYSRASEAFVAVGQITRVFSVVVWLLAVAGAILCGWAMLRIGLILVAGLVPFAIPLVQSYGGEAIYRVYLYALPLMAALIAWGILTRIPITPRRFLPQPTVLACVVCLVLAAGFMVAHFGREQTNQVDRSEVAMEEFIATHVKQSAVIAQFADGYPSRSTARYPSQQVNDTYIPEVVKMLGSSLTLPPPAALDRVADELAGLTDGTAYVVISPGMVDSVKSLQQLPVTDTNQAAAFMLANQRFVVNAHIGQTWLLEVRQ